MKKLSNLSTEEKTVIILSFILGVSCFLPWWSYKDLFSELKKETAFDGILAINGYVIFTFAVLAFLSTIVACFDFTEKITKNKKKIKFASSLFLSLSFIILLITMFSNNLITKLEFANEYYSSMKIEFSFYIAFFSSFMALFFSIVFIKDKKKATIHKTKYTTFSNNKDSETSNILEELEI